MEYPRVCAYLFVLTTQNVLHEMEAAKCLLENSQVLFMMISCKVGFYFVSLVLGFRGQIYLIKMQFLAFTKILFWYFNSGF